MKHFLQYLGSRKAW